MSGFASSQFTSSPSPQQPTTVPEVSTLIQQYSFSPSVAVLTHHTFKKIDDNGKDLLYQTLVARNYTRELHGLVLDRAKVSFWGATQEPSLEKSLAASFERTGRPPLAFSRPIIRELAPTEIKVKAAVVSLCMNLLTSSVDILVRFNEGLTRGGTRPLDEAMAIKLVESEFRRKLILPNPFEKEEQINRLYNDRYLEELVLPKFR